MSSKKDKQIKFLRVAYSSVSAKLYAEKKTHKITEQALKSAELANDKLHEKLDCYRTVIRDI